MRPEAAERFILNVAEKSGTPIISTATARELDRLYAPGLAVNDDERSDVLYAVAVGFAIGPN